MFFWYILVCKSREATSEYWYTLLLCELETLCVMAQYNGERILYNQCGTKHISGIILRAWASLTMNGEYCLSLWCLWPL